MSNSTEKCHQTGSITDVSYQSSPELCNDFYTGLLFVGNYRFTCCFRYCYTLNLNQYKPTDYQ